MKLFVSYTVCKEHVPAEFYSQVLEHELPKSEGDVAAICRKLAERRNVDTWDVILLFYREM